MIPKHPAREVVVVFVKFPTPGQVKTRLAASLGQEMALRIYDELVKITMSAVGEWLDRVPQDGGAPPPRSAWITFTPVTRATDCRAWLAQALQTWPAPPDWIPQAEGDLGDRLQHIFHEALNAGFSRICVIGSDCPGLTATTLEAAFAHLANHGVTIGPTSDGGYYLIGLNTPCPFLFKEIPWSTERTLTVTLDRARLAGLSVALLPSLDDIDTEADWRRWQAGQDRAAGLK